MKGIVRITAAALLCATLFTGCGGMENKNSAVGFHMDTVIMLTGYCDEALLTEAIALCGRYEKLLSRTVEGSDVWKINHAGGDPVIRLFMPFNYKKPLSCFALPNASAGKLYIAKKNRLLGWNLVFACAIIALHGIKYDVSLGGFSI